MSTKQLHLGSPNFQNTYMIIELQWFTHGVPKVGLGSQGSLA